MARNCPGDSLESNAIARVQRDKQTHIQRNDFQAWKPVGHRATASKTPCRLTQNVPSQIAKKPLHRGNHRLIATKEVETVMR